jgi:hypothetical protein
MRFLSNDELIDLTGLRRPTAQARALRSMGIDFRTRPDGKVIVIDADLTLKNHKPLGQKEEFTLGSSTKEWRKRRTA